MPTRDGDAADVEAPLARVRTRIREGGDDMRPVTDLTDEQMAALTANVLTLGE